MKPASAATALLVCLLTACDLRSWRRPAGAIVK